MSTLLEISIGTCPNTKESALGISYQSFLHSMEFIKFNIKHFSFLNFLDIFDFTLIFLISTSPKTSKKVQLTRQLICLRRLISKSFVFSGRFGGRFCILRPIRWPFQYFGRLPDSVAISVFSGRFGGRFSISVD